MYNKYLKLDAEMASTLTNYFWLFIFINISKELAPINFYIMVIGWSILIVRLVGKQFKEKSSIKISITLSTISIFVLGVAYLLAIPFISGTTMWIIYAWSGLTLLSNILNYSIVFKNLLKEEKQTKELEDLDNKTKEQEIYELKEKLQKSLEKQQRLEKRNEVNALKNKINKDVENI